MRKLIILLVTALLVLSASIASPAQENQANVLDLARETDDLSSFVAAIEAADPSIAEALGNDGAYTVFAPSNQAFENLLISLNLTEEALLAHPLLTDILNYHVLDGEFFSESIATLDGQSVATRLADNFVAVAVEEDGSILLNDLVSVSSADIDASNGVIHLIDNVLLPQAALEAFALVPAQNSNIQVLHFAADAPNIDVYIDGELSIQNLGFGTSSGYITLEAGDYELAISPTGAPLDDAVISPVALSLQAGEFVNFAVIGSVEAESLNLTRFNQAFPALGENEIAITVLHTVESAPDIDLLVNAEPVIEALAYPFSQGDNDGAFNLTLSLDEAIESLTVNVNEEESVLLDLSDTPLESQTYYLIVVAGTADVVTSYLFPIGTARAEELDNALYIDMSMDEDTAMETSDMSVVETVMASANSEDAEFTIFLAALENADPAILEALQSAESVTVFAPSDQAFSNLLSSTGMTEEELLASDYLNDILRYHIVMGEYRSEDILELDGQLIPSLLEDRFIGVAVDEDSIILNGVVEFSETDIPATNGIIHVVNDVLLPDYILEVFGLS